MKMRVSDDFFFYLDCGILNQDRFFGKDPHDQ